VVTWQGRSSDVVVFNGPDGQIKAIICPAKASNPFSNFAAPADACAGVNPGFRPQARWDWGLAGFYGGRLAAYLAIAYAIGWAVFRGLRWAALRFLADEPE